MELINCNGGNKSDKDDVLSKGAKIESNNDNLLKSKDYNLLKSNDTKNQVIK